MIINNMTPHDITLMTEDKEIIEIFPKSEEPIRLESKQVIVGNTDKCPIKQVCFGLSNLPDYEKGVYYIVSALVANAYPERKDLFMVNETVRDENGRIQGCKSFAVVNWEHGGE